MCQPRPPLHLPVALSLRKLFSPEHRGYRVVCTRPLQFTQIQSFRGASPACVSALLVTAGFCGSSSSAHSFPLGVCSLGTVRTGTPPFWVMARQVPGSRRSGFVGC